LWWELLSFCADQSAVVHAGETAPQRELSTANVSYVMLLLTFATRHPGHWGRLCIQLHPFGEVDLHVLSCPSLPDPWTYLLLLAGNKQVPSTEAEKGWDKEEKHAVLPS